VVTAPATALSAVVVASYKKLVMVTLLAPPTGAGAGKAALEGEKDAKHILPKYTPNVVARHVKQIAAPYIDIYNAVQVSFWNRCRPCDCGM
jgi:hypothetical protein